MRSAFLQIIAIVLTGVACALLLAGPTKPGQTDWADRTVTIDHIATAQR